MKLRLLLILPLNGGSLIVGSHLADALRRMAGIDLDILAMQPLHDRLVKDCRSTADRNERLRRIGRSLDQTALDRVRAFKPDLVLVMALAPVGPWFIEQVKHLGVLTAHWYIENFRYYPAHPVIPRWQIMAPCYDYFFTIQKGAFFDALKSIGVNRFDYLPLGCNPSIHCKKTNSTPAEPLYDSDICFIGSPYPNRIALFQMLQDFQLALWGPGWEQIPGLKKFSRGSDRLVDGYEENKIINGAKIGFNIHSSLDPQTLFFKCDFLNPRIFTIAACGVFQLTDAPEPLPETFEIGKEIMTYHDPDSLKYCLRYFLNHPEERAEISAKAHQRVLEEHTFQNRMNRMLHIMGCVS